MCKYEVTWISHDFYWINRPLGTWFFPISLCKVGFWVQGSHSDPTCVDSTFSWLNSSFGGVAKSSCPNGTYLR
uniref:Uncharacterized protein n=1 Tax=Arundo donax TaxID=35708 RepID=A0A0A9AX67_ARUDO